jgi:hypothetical protein
MRIINCGMVVFIGGIMKRRDVRVPSVRAAKMTAAFALAVGIVAAMGAPAARAQDNKQDGDFSAGINVSGKADAKAVGLPIYPHSRPHKDNSDDSSSANLGLWGGSYGFKLAVMKMETDAKPDKVAEFYRKALKKYGDVLDCTNAPAETQEQKDADEKSNTLSCSDDRAKNGGMVYKAGKRDEQHIVSVEPNGSGTVFNLVYLSTKGLDNK